MLKLTWKSWLAVLIGLLAVFGGLFTMLSAQGEPTIAYWLGFAGAVLSTVWSCIGLIRWREVTWVKRVNTFVLATLGFGLLVLLFRALAWTPGYTTAQYCYFAVLGFLLGMNLLRLLLRPGHPVLGVARTMVEESLRLGISLIFIIGILAILPLLPVILGSDDRVTYMVQRFLTFSTSIVGILLGLMTVLLASWTVSREIASRQIHMTLTKPLGRAEYLLGKWLGIVLLNAVLLVVAGVAIYGFTVGIARNPALNDLDRYEVDREVLTARLAQQPGPVGTTWQGMYVNVLEEKQLTDPVRFGESGSSFATLADDARQEVIADTVSRFYTVSGGQSQDYVLTGLGPAAEAAARAITEARTLLVQEAGFTQDQAEDYINAGLGRPNEMDVETASRVSEDLRDRVTRLLEREVIQLSLTPRASPKPENLNSEIYMEINGQPWPMPASLGAAPPRTRVVNEIANELPLPAFLIDGDGQMVLTITVPAKREDGTDQRSMSFNYKDNVIEVFYRVGTFEANLAKAMLIVWFKLAFLAMVGLMAGSLMSFPVAAMMSLIVFVAAAASGTITESLDNYIGFAKGESTWQVVTGTFSGLLGAIGAGNIYDVFKLMLRLIGESFMLVIPSFGSYNTARPLSDGHVITTGTVANAALYVSLIPAALVGAIGLILFQRKEIARVQV